MEGGSGNDTIAGGSGRDSVIGGSGNDRVAGHSGRDLVEGGSGDDTVLGNKGSDTVFGGSSDDFVRGQAGVDLIVGNTGSDRLSGGSGADMFLFESEDVAAGDRDIVTDFEFGVDNILVDTSENVESISQSGTNVRVTCENGYVLVFRNQVEANIEQLADNGDLGPIA